MSKKNIITLNSAQYDAKTGVLLTNQPTAAIPPMRHVTKSTARKPARHAAPHTPHPSRTLMRKAVKKPSSSKRTVKAHPHLDTVAARSLSDILVKPSVKRLDATRLQHAVRVKKSRLVSRFSADLFSGNLANPPHQIAPRPAAVQQNRRSFGEKPKTTTELLEYALLRANAHEQESPKLARRSLFKRKTRSATT